ncbi:MAG: HI0074 family nucleotidyltransferase substrate-binding subunit [Bilifractor sp.]
MEQKKYINRYNSFLNSLSSLEKARNRDLSDDFVVSGTVQKYCLTFDISWKVMKDILINYHKITGFASGSPRETLRTASQAGLITGDVWMHMLLDRNNLTHDYDGKLAAEAVHRIIEIYIPVLEQFRDTAASYIKEIGQDDAL